MSRLHPHKVARQVREIQGHAVSIEAAAPGLARVNDWIDDGRRGTDFDALRRGGADGSAPELAALRDRTDWVTRGVAQLQKDLNEAHRRLRRARRIVDALTLRASEKATRGPGEGDCVVCNHYVPGIANDRLRAGRCNPCRVWWERHGEERPRERWDEGEAA